jgi:hypothetical protein
MPIRALLLLAALALAAAPAQAQPRASAEAWRTDVPCTAGDEPALVVSDSATERHVPGCVRAHCVDLYGGGRVCTCTRDTTIVVRLESGGETVREWPADYSLAGAPESLGAVQGDLDGDGDGETIVSELTAVSNGLGVRHYRLSIFGDASRPPVQVNVQDFDPHGSFVRPARGGECRLIATRWAELPDPERGEGMYLVGQWMRYRPGRLEHEPDRPIVVRRLLNSFAAARWDTPGAPFAFLRHRDARAHAGHGMPPLPRHVRTEEGAFRSMRGDTVVVALEPNVISGHTLGDFHREEDGWIFTAWLVDGATGRPYPPGYRPSDERWLDGVPVRQDTYVKDEERTVFVLTIRPRTASRP